MPISFATTPTWALSGGNNRATALFLNASPYRAIFAPYRPQVQDHIGATTILTRGATKLQTDRFYALYALITVLAIVYLIKKF